MKYFKFTSYIYLAASVFFLIYGIRQVNEGDPGSWLSFVLAAMSVFMFFFRRRFARRFENRNGNPGSKSPNS